MRGHFGCPIFDMPPFPPRVGPYDRGFGPWERTFGPQDSAFGPYGRGRPPFGRPGWPDFNRCDCRPEGPSGEGHSPDRHGPHHESDNEDQREHRRCRRGRSPECRRRGSPEGHHGPHHGHPRCSRGRTEEQHGRPGCHRRETSDNNCECSHHGPWDCSARCGPPRHGHHHRGFGPDRCSFGPPPFPGGGFDWPGFSPDRRRPHFGPWFGHGRPSPYDRPRGCSPPRDCKNCHGGCCSGNRGEETSNVNDARRNENRPCAARNNDQNETGDTVLMQRIVVEKGPTRPPTV